MLLKQNVETYLESTRKELAFLKHNILKVYIDEESENPMYILEVVMENETLFGKYLLAIRSYILLAHAAIEDLLESLAVFYLAESVALWKNRRILNELLGWQLFNYTDEVKKRNNFSGSSPKHALD